MLLTITIVIGVGIFFKNKAVFSAAHGESWIVITAWVVGALIAMSSAIAFALISKKLKHNDNSVAEYARFTYGKKVGSSVKKWITYIYFPIFSFTIALFTSMQFFELVNIPRSNSYYWIYLYVATFVLVFLYIGLITINFKIVKRFNIFTSFVKMLPFVVFLIVALSAIWSSNEHAYWAGNPLKTPHDLNPSVYNATSSLGGVAIVFWVIPSILFTLDGYIVITGNKRASSSRALALGMTVGMAIVATFYIGAAVAMLKEGVASVPEAIVQFFGGNIFHMSVGYQVIYKSVNIIIVISGLGSFGGFVILWKRLLYQSADDRGKKHKDHTLKHMALGLMYSCAPWVIFMVLLQNINNIPLVGGEVFDEVSNVVLLMSFFINGLILARATWMAWRKKIKASWVFYILALFASGVIFSVVGWVVIDKLIIDIIRNPLAHGLFNLPKWSYILFFITALLQFIGAIFIFKRKKNVV